MGFGKEGQQRWSQPTDWCMTMAGHRSIRAKVQRNETITASFMMVLLLSSFMVIIVGMNHVDAEETSYSEVGASSGSNRFLVWEDGKPENLDIFFRRSADNGATWQATKNLSTNAGHSFSPEITVSGSNVYVVWLQRDAGGTLNDIFFRRSADNGATWKPIVKITTTGTVGGFSTPQVMTSGSKVYVVWEQENGEIYFRRSADNGATWKPIINLSSNAGNSLSERIAVSGSNVYVVWFQWNAEETQTDVFLRRSTDNGATWKAKVNLSKTGEAVGVPDIALSGSYVHVAWVQHDQASGFRDQIFVRSSPNNGATWNTAQNLSMADPKYEFTHPVLASSGAHVYVLYEEVVEGCCDYTTDIFFRASHDNGATWETVTTIATHVIQNQGSAALLLAAGSNVYAIWVVADYGAYGDLFVRRSIDNGDTWGPVSADLNNKNRPPRELRAAASGSSIYLVWSNIYPREVYFLRSIDSGTIWKSVQNISNNLGPSASPSFGM